MKTLTDIHRDLDCKGEYMNKYFDIKDKVYDVTEKYPELIEVLANAGFENLRNDMMRKSMGKLLSIETALKSKNINVDVFERQLVEAIERKSDMTDNNGVVRNVDEKAKVSIKGILPCPVRMQFIESFEKFVESRDYKINYNLNAASMGMEAIEDEILNAKDENDLSDIYMSAGFNLFFDKKYMGKFRDKDIFVDHRSGELNKSLDNENISLRDPKGEYSIIGVVPAIFIVNNAVLGDRKVPASWEDLFDKEFENSIALPTSDLDMFNAIMLGIYSRYGREGVEALGRGLLKSMHPAQMVKSGSRKDIDTPTVSIMPYFFSKTIKENSGLTVVWPKDGAVISPIFLLTKKKNYENSKQLIDFLFSKQIAEVLGADGKFPQTNSEYDNKLEESQSFLWAGWDFIHSNDIGEILSNTEKWFFGEE